MRPLSRISCHGQGHASDQKIVPWTRVHLANVIDIKQENGLAHMRNEYPHHKQRTSPARPLARLGSSRITAKRFRRIIIESVSVFSNLLPLSHLRRKLTTGRATLYRMPRQMPRSLIYSVLRRERTPRPRSQRRQGQPWPDPRACATAARKECPAQSRGNRTSKPHL